MTREELIHSAIAELQYQNEIDELYHHGILGMKWGVRRYQNEDGTLTDTGKKKYAENYSKSQRLRDRSVYSRGAVKRINNKMLQGRGIQDARSNEAERIERYRNAAQSVKSRGIRSVGGAIGGLAGSYFSKNVVDAVDKFVNRPVMVDTPINRFIGKHGATISRGADYLNNNLQGQILRNTVGGIIGSGVMGTVLPEMASRGVMRLGGYSPDKRR